MKEKEILKKSKGITLIALVITIIVLLILAGVTIATLTGDNGLLSKASGARDTSTEAEILEKLKLAYQDYYLGQHTNPGYTFQNAVDKMFGTGVATVTEANGVYTVTFTISGKKYTFNPVTGIAGEYVDQIKYYDSTNNEIAKTDITHLDHLIIGETEKFKVISTTNGILAMPYYNLVTVTADGTVKQGPAVEGTSVQISSTFSDSPYWQKGTDEIDMSDSNIQQYITKYQTTLEGLGANGIIVRAAKYSELTATGITNEMRNPGQNGSYWTGSSYYHQFSWDIYIMTQNGGTTYGSYTGSDGVRPVIEIH